MNIFIDIETFGNKPEIKPLVLPTEADIKYGNIKDPDKIRAKIEEELPKLISKAKEDHEAAYDKEWRDNALNKTKCDVVAVSLISEDFGFDELYYGDEPEIFAKIESDIKKIGHKVFASNFVHWNGDAFDIPIMGLRSLKYRCPSLFRALPLKKFDTRSVDLMQKFCFTDYRGRISMDSALKFFGLETKTMSGADVHDHILSANIKGVADYCRNDVLRLIDLYNIYTMTDGTEQPVI